MKLFVFLAVVALSNGAKLDRTYLPPSYAQTSGGSGNFLQTPISGSNDYQNNGFTQTASGSGRNGFAQSSNDYTQNGVDFGQNGNDFAQNSNDFAQNGNEFDQNGNGIAQGTAGFGNNFESRPERAQAAFERNAAILRQDNQNDGETYAYAFETENGIIAEENGIATNGVEAQGGFSYTGDDGQVYSIRYTADQNGFVPQGDHLPTPPPIPIEIQEALEQNARDEASGIYDDGSYNEAKYNGDNFDNSNTYNEGNNYENGNTGNNYEAGNNYNGGENYNAEDEDTVVTNNALFRSSNGPAARNQAFGQENSFNAANKASVNSLEKAYLPPFGQRSRLNGATQNQVTGFRAQGLNQGPFGNEPDFANQRSSQNEAATPQDNGFRVQRPNQGFGNQASGVNAVEKAYLAPFASGENIKNAGVPQVNGFRSQRPNQEFRNQASDVDGVEKAYLPPFASQRSSQNLAALPQNQAARFGARANQGFGNQGADGNGVEKAYIPPFESTRSSQNLAASPISGFRARARQGFGGSDANGVEKAYLPPFASQRSDQNNQADAPGFRSQGSFGANSEANAVTNAYLPPFGQRTGESNARNGFSRRQQSFNARTGYQY